MARNNFPKGSLVKLVQCKDPECRCGNKYLLGEDGMVVNARGRYIAVKCRDYESIMERMVIFTKAKAANHLELLSTKFPVSKLTGKEKPNEV